MKAQDFLDWMENVGAKSGADLVRSLGMGRNRAQGLVTRAHEGREVDLKLADRLAMAAVAHDLAPWGDKEEGDMT